MKKHFYRLMQPVARVARPLGAAGAGVLTAGSSFAANTIDVSTLTPDLSGVTGLALTILGALFLMFSVRKMIKTVNKS